MPAYPALETRSGVALAEFSRHLWKRRIVHRIFDRPDGSQVVVVARPEDVAPVREAFERWQRGELEHEPQDAGAWQGSGSLPGTLQRSWRQQPVTILAIVLSIAGALLVSLDHGARVLRWFSFTSFQLLPDGRIAFEDVATTWAHGEYWRLLTPVFLHFGVLHLAFNSLWLLELGRRIERVRGSGTMLALLVLTGVGGNIAQYLYDGTVMFGGMSGVIYGLLGYAWVWMRLSGDHSPLLPPGVMVVMLVWLVVCMSGLVEAIGFGAVANAAHVGGLVLGALLGLGAALLYSRPPASGDDGS